MLAGDFQWSACYCPVSSLKWIFSFTLIEAFQPSVSPGPLQSPSCSPCATYQQAWTSSEVGAGMWAWPTKREDILLSFHCTSDEKTKWRQDWVGCASVCGLDISSSWILIHWNLKRNEAFWYHRSKTLPLAISCQSSKIPYFKNLHNLFCSLPQGWDLP